MSLYSLCHSYSFTGTYRLVGTLHLHHVFITSVLLPSSSIVCAQTRHLHPLTVIYVIHPQAKYSTSGFCANQIKSTSPPFFFSFFFFLFLSFFKIVFIKNRGSLMVCRHSTQLDREGVFPRCWSWSVTAPFTTICLFVCFFFFKSQLRLRRHTTQRQKDPVRVCVSAGAETWPNTQRFQDRSCWPLCGELVLKHTHAHTRAHTHTHTHTHTQTFENLSSKEAFLWTLLYWMYCWL